MIFFCAFSGKPKSFVNFKKSLKKKNLFQLRQKQANFREQKPIYQKTINF